MTGLSVEQFRTLRGAGRTEETLTVLDARLVEQPDDAVAQGKRALSRSRLGDIKGTRVGARCLPILAPGEFST